MNPETAPCINGPKLAAWLKEKDRLPAQVYGPDGKPKKDDPVNMLYRRVNAWQNGAQANYFTVAKWFALIDLHPSQLPDDFYEAERPKRKPKQRTYSPAEKQRALQLLKDGLAPGEVAKGLGCSRRSLSVWRKQAA